MAAKKRRAFGFKQNKAMLIILSSVLILMAALFIQENRMRKKIEANQTRIQEVELQIEQETQRTQDIQELEQYMQSPEYIEKVAKDKLGLIKDGETIFKEQK
ncbi:MAG: septum formation initiator family protein [Lachnospiraceae bacterium]|nr:septum formation initiator family protein [Lachnospiraceae bacterium]